MKKFLSVILVSSFPLITYAGDSRDLIVIVPAILAFPLLIISFTAHLISKFISDKESGTVKILNVVKKITFWFSIIALIIFFWYLYRFLA